MGRSESPTLLPPHFVAFAWRYHPVRLSSSLPLGPTPAGGQEVLVWHLPHQGLSRWKQLRLPRFLENPLCLCRVLRPRQEHLHVALTMQGRGPRSSYDEGSHEW